MEEAVPGEAPARAEIDTATLPPLWHDRAFLGMTATQFLGAFNDNVFKQMILLFIVVMIVDKQSAASYQFAATVVFAVPFILFSGFCGFLADRCGKWTIVFSSKVLEIAIMLLGMAAFYTGQIWPLLVVLFLMGSQTTLFSPAKYGILPEIFRHRDLPRVNGIISMTTFLAIIFGMVIGGAASELARKYFDGEYWLVNSFCVLVAIGGTVTALVIRRPPPASANLQFRPRDVFMTSETWTMLRTDRPLTLALVVSSTFWFLGAMVQLAITQFGVQQLDIGELRTSIMSGTLSVGIAIGFVVAGRLSEGTIRFSLLKYGACGIAASMIGIAVVAVLPIVWGLKYAALLFVFLTSGFSTGLFALPITTYLQVRPPSDQKGRVIAAMNLFNWIGICFAGFAYFACVALLTAFKLPMSWTFAIIGLLMVPVPLLYHPPNENIEAEDDQLCPSCGERNRADESTCGMCGAPLDPQDEAVETSASPAS
ncbi:MFS transporter [Stratiformator vulcanicus]|uniref:Lysophospholipid transporter LplT n=1 Tax=Stratiformator vulcanicus TaxID=2527980 RepID=A0A517R4S5_9PLAN|nr:MFS transporter [Stratiformator vulcanicus]QDT38872.1 Lysophospholipid transporter LplT [Stratiformator vulcanicus]